MNSLKTFAWTLEGVVRAGTLSEYARDRQQAELADLTVSDELWDGTRTQTVRILADPVGADGVRRYEVLYGVLSASCSVDGRS
ncbi:hypothetical protein ABTY20_19195 [Streptomyces sp. NPDC126497]|uniref:hypothetical protein n=1 Tax=Streptomyces sp. NPDC126497 TaxID=3155313 RepID=UPI0033246CAB